MWRSGVGAVVETINLFLQGYGYRGILKEENENNVKWEEVKKEARNTALLR